MELSDALPSLPLLPFEIRSLIIEEMLAMAPKRAVEMVSLSRGLQPIVERCLYRCVILKNNRRPTALFLDMIKSGCRPDTFYRDRVKVLCITSLLDFPDLDVILTACSGVQSLAIYHWRPIGFNMAALNALPPRPTRFSSELDWVVRPNGHRFSLPFFENITHLELNMEGVNFKGKELHSLKNLTHLSVITPPPQTVSWLFAFFAGLDLSDSIVVCIVYVEPNIILKVRRADVDPRIVIAARESRSVRGGSVLCRDLPDREHYIRQWGIRLDEEELDMWEEAEKKVKAQRFQLSSRAIQGKVF
ncbi:hypothetical protein C8J56DRAFT_962476 [Mycena floridula]|nr:hypothetical protein C8J56DRAFT_962476 [Mycena floridula]